MEVLNPTHMEVQVSREGRMPEATSRPDQFTYKALPVGFPNK